MKLKRCVGAAILGLVLLIHPAWAGTGFQMEAVAAKVVSPSVRGKLIWARATEGPGVDPSKWSFLFYDPYADENGRHIVVINGGVTQIEQGFVELDHARLLSYKPSEIMPAAKLKFDSDRALAAVLAVANIENVHLSTVHYELSQSQDNDVPVWKITIYRMWHANEARLCTARVSAFTGQIFSLDVDRSKI
jgi:hypothetical protein